MIKIIFVVLAILIFIIFPVRFAISSSGFLNDGIMEGIQTCKSNEECVWASTGCCDCELGGGEILINKNKELTYKILIKPLCLEEEKCFGEDACHYEEVYCDRTCKSGEKTYQKPLFSQ